jgi:putative peptide zinc metalloprotease protein
MVALSPPLPARRSELVIRPLGERGRYVIKDPRSGSYFQLGQQEHFLLMQLDGARDARVVCEAFAERFAEPLSDEDLEGFLAIARRKGLLESTECGVRSAELDTHGSSSTPQSAIRSPHFKQSILYWRKSFWDPDRCFTWLAPRLRIFWTPTFVVLAVSSIVVASVLLATSGQAVTASFASSLRWETAFWVWLTLFIVTMLHESAHGLTCKHYGGEVHEIGFLLMFFMPCFYCNVSDAWLFRERSKRLWVTLAGGFFELFLWALAVFTWRLTLPGSLPNYLAFIVVSACGVRSLFNFNPLLKLDGYYLLSDWLEIPNLRQRAIGYLMAQLRRVLWGASRPSPEPRALVLVSYGLLSWTYSLVFLSLMLWGLAHLLGTRWGIVGWGAGGALAVLSLNTMFRGLSAGEVTAMLRTRLTRTALWGIGLAALAAGGFMPIDDWATGEFQVRPTTRAELRAPLAGFIAEVYAEEGDPVSAGQCVMRLAIPDLQTRIVQKQAEVLESQARLRLLEQGARPEEVAEQRLRVERGEQWRDLADEDLQHAREALAADLARLEHELEESRAELEAARKRFQRDESLASKGAVTKDQLEEAERALRVAQAKLDQRQAEERARRAEGTRAAAAELARRSKELADDKGRLALLEAGTRRDEIEAERSRLGRLAEELRYLASLQDKLAVTSAVAGIVTTPRLKERVGQFVHDGDSLCVVEQASVLVAEIALDEQQHSRVSAGQPVQLKFRALPFQTFAGRVERIAPAAVKEELMAQGRFTVYCRVAGDTANLRQGMSGHARISTGRQPIGIIVTDRALRLLRTEFWW